MKRLLAQLLIFLGILEGLQRIEIGVLLLALAICFVGIAWLHVLVTPEHPDGA